MTRFYIEGAEEFDRACRLPQVIGVFELFDIDYEEV